MLILTPRQALQAMLFNSGMSLTEIAAKGGFKNTGLVKDIIFRESRTITAEEFLKFLKVFGYTQLVAAENLNLPSFEIGD